MITSCVGFLQDGITAFEALESGVLRSLRELLAWLEGAAVVTTAAQPVPLGAPTATAAGGAGGAAAVELERDTVKALALVPAGGATAAGGGEGKGGSQAVLEVGITVFGGGGGVRGGGACAVHLNFEVGSFVCLFVRLFCYSRVASCLSFLPGSPLARYFVQHDTPSLPPRLLSSPALFRLFITLILNPNPLLPCGNPGPPTKKNKHANNRAASAAYPRRDRSGDPSSGRPGLQAPLHRQRRWQSGRSRGRGWGARYIRRCPGHLRWRW